MWSQVLNASRFVAVGLVCAGLHNLVIIGLDQVGVHYVLASFASYVVCVGVGFVLHARVTFRVQVSCAAFRRYALAMAANVPIAVAMLWLLCELVLMPVSLAAPVATVLMFAWNFVASRWAVLQMPQLAQKENCR
jgi:putative flippase GtrA